MASPLEEWKFLIGKWKGKTIYQLNDEGNITSKYEFKLEPSEKFIHSKHEAHNKDGLVNKSLSYLYYDSNDNKFKRKSIFSYGFINNEIEYFHDDNSIHFEIKIEPLPTGFEGIDWRSYLKKISETEVVAGLELRKEGEQYKTYNEAQLLKLRNA